MGPPLLVDKLHHLLVFKQTQHESLENNWRINNNSHEIWCQALKDRSCYYETYLQPIWSPSQNRHSLVVAHRLNANPSKDQPLLLFHKHKKETTIMYW